jgi:hypothetical protein
MNHDLKDDPIYRRRFHIALREAGVYLDPDGVEFVDGSAYLLRGHRQIAKMSEEAFGLLDDDVRAWMKREGLTRLSSKPTPIIGDALATRTA